MVDINELKKKFPTKVAKAADDASKGPMHRKSSKAAVKAIAREYEMKRAELQGSGAPTFRRGPVFYLMLIVGLMVIGWMVLTASRDGIGLGKKRIELKPMQVRKSMDALVVALGRYKFHTGEYPSTAEGLNALAVKAFPKKGWDGPYINHVARDPWGNEYYYETRPEGGHPILYSKGPNGRAGDDDDILPDQEMFEQPFRDTSWTNGWAPYRLRGVVVAPDELTKRKIQEEMKQYDPKPAESVRPVDATAR